MLPRSLLYSNAGDCRQFNAAFGKRKGNNARYSMIIIGFFGDWARLGVHH